MCHSSLSSGGGHSVLAASLHVCTLSWPPRSPPARASGLRGAGVQRVAAQPDRWHLRA